MKIFWIFTLTVCFARHESQEKAETRIFRAIKAPPYVYKTYVAIGFYKEDSNDVQNCCGGTLIGKRTVLTAAKCFECVSGKEPSAIVFLGSYFLVKHPFAVTYSVGKENFKFPGGFPPTDDEPLKIDVAIFHLPEDVTFTDHIGAARLFKARVMGKMEGVMVGYGDLDVRTTKTLQIAPTKVISKKDFLDIMSGKLRNKHYMLKKRESLSSIDPETAALNDEALRNTLLNLYNDNLPEDKVFIAYNEKSHIEKGDAGGPFMPRVYADVVCGVATVTIGEMPAIKLPGFTVFARIDRFRAWIEANTI